MFNELELGNPFQASLMFASKAKAYPSKETFRCFTLGWAPVLTNIGWKGLPGTNTLDYYEHL